MATDTAAFSQSLIARKGVIGEVTPTAGAFRWSRPFSVTRPMQPTVRFAANAAVRIGPVGGGDRPKKGT